MEADKSAFLALCEDHFSVKPALSYPGCRRLGKVSDQQQQPRKLLVHLMSEDAVKQVLSEAKKLRRSDDGMVAASVFINPDRSPAEAKLAFERRQQRREAQRRRSQQATTGVSAASVDSVAHLANMASKMNKQKDHSTVSTSAPVLAGNSNLPSPDAVVDFVPMSAKLMSMCSLTQLLTRPFVAINNRHGYNCCILNARSIVNKLPELHYLLYNNNYSVICITETWLHSEITGGLLDPLSIYHTIRKDRVGSHHGGVAVLIKRLMCFAEITIDRVYDSLELLCFDVIFSKCKVRFFVIYRPPYYDQLASDYIDLLIRCVKQYSSTERCTTNVVVGDLNCPKIDWKNLTSS